MAKIISTDLSSQERRELLGNLLETVEKTKDKDDAVDFLIGLLRPSELLMLARRVQIAKKLLNGESYEKIRGDLSVGFDTISKTEKWLHSGDKSSDEHLEKLLSLKANNKEEDPQMFSDALSTYGGSRSIQQFLQHR